MCVFKCRHFIFFFLYFSEVKLGSKRFNQKRLEFAGQGWDTGSQRLSVLDLIQWKSSLYHNFSPACLQTRTVHESLFYPFSFRTPHIKSWTPCFCHIIWLHLCTDAVSILKAVQAIRGDLFSVLGHLFALSYNLFRGKKQTNKKHVVDMHGYEEKKSDASKSTQENISYSSIDSTYSLFFK